MRQPNVLLHHFDLFDFFAVEIKMRLSGDAKLKKLNSWAVFQFPAAGRNVANWGRT